MFYKQRILNFMRKKDEILLRYTGEHIFDESLFESTITEETCEEMTKILTTKQNLDNSDLCPWCIQYHICLGSACCLACTYGKKYGECDSCNSHYNKIIGILQDDLYHFINIQEIEHALKKFRKEKSTN